MIRFPDNIVGGNMKIQDLTINGYEFSGYIEVDEVEMDVYGEFGISWEGNVPIIDLMSLHLVGGQELYATDIDFFDLIQQIQNSGQDTRWYEDKFDYYRES